jgi:hypothetical protein
MLVMKVKHEGITIEKISNQKQMKTMAKRIIEMTSMALLCVGFAAFAAPCLLMFSCGKDGEITWLNFVGIAWCWIVYKALRAITHS